MSLSSGDKPAGEPQSTLAVGPGDLVAWRLDVATDTLECDGAMRRLWGFDEAAPITGELAFSRVHPDDIEGLREAIEESLRDGAFYQKDFRIVLPGGEIRYIGSRAKPLVGADGSLHLSGLNWDITKERQSQRALAASERLRRVALDAAEMGVWEIELATRVVRWDSHCRQLFGFESDADVEMTMERAVALLEPEDRDAVFETFQRATQSPEGTRHSIEYRVHVRDEVRWIRTVARCAFKRGPEGPVAERLLGVNQDVTARKNEEARLFAEAELSRIALESAELGTWELILATNTVRWDARCAELFGFEPSETQPVEDILSILNPDDRPAVEAALAKALDPAGTGHYQAHFRTRGPRGEERWIRSVGQAHFSEAGGPGTPRAERFFGVVMDDTARRRSEETLRKWQGILRGGGWGSATVQPDVEPPITLPQTQEARELHSLSDPDRLEAVTETGLLDAPPSEVLDRITEMACRLLRVPVALVSLVDDGRQFFAGQSGFEGEAATRRETPLTQSFCQHVTVSAAPLVVPDAHHNPVVSTNRAIQDLGVRAYLGVPLVTPGGHAVGALCSISGETRDWTSEDLSVLQSLGQLVVTEITLRTYVRKNQRAQAAAEAANRAKSEFLANMSHEIRTPMSAILGYADILARNETDPDNLELVETIRRNGRHLLDILNDILDLAKIESGKFEARTEWFQVAEVIEEVVSMLGYRSAEQELELSGHLLTEIPERIKGDAIRLRQILVNLVGNAIKFTGTGSVRIEGSFEPLSAEVVIAVTDTGPGIAPEAIERLFEPFTQADSTAQRIHGGTGLGLTICRRFAAALGGTLTATSEVGKGSRFELRIPAGSLDGVPRVPPGEIRPHSGPSQEDVQRVQGAEPLAGRRVLVVDDRRELRTLVQMLLEEAGSEVSTAGNGVEAIEEYQRSPGAFDAVLMDMQMPVMDGYTAARALRDMGATLPIIAVTAHALTGEQDRCLAAGCNAYVTKPLDDVVLMDVLARHLGASAEAPGR